MKYILISLLILIVILIIYLLCKNAKSNNFDLKYKENVLFIIPTFILIFTCLFNFEYYQTKIALEIPLLIFAFFVIILVIYYVVRIIVLKKYIPLKIILFNIINNLLILYIIYMMADKVTSNIDGENYFELLVLYFIVSLLYVSVLLLINIIVFIVKSIKKNHLNYNNKNYSIIKMSILYIAMCIMTSLFIIFVDKLNLNSYNKLLLKQKSIVNSYLKSEYSEYSFKIIDSYKTKTDCYMFGCKTNVIRNEILNFEYNKQFNIDVIIKDLQIKDDEFKKIKEENSIRK